ncbi:MAG: hypothetical protein J0M19_04570 [Sphingomonadales bacterium]|nr:hypothetical protein [Sphingomonadales bacterium]
MAIFPRIQSPCPYRDNLAAIMDGSFCRMCKREVHDISGLSDAERQALVASCKDEICVSYTVAAKTAVAAAALGAALGMPMAAAAQNASAAASEEIDDNEAAIIVGGLKQPKQTKWVEVSRPSGMAELPVVYETTAPTRTVKAPASAKSRTVPATGTKRDPAT